MVGAQRSAEPRGTPRLADPSLALACLTTLRPPPLQPARPRRRVAAFVDQSIIDAFVIGRHHLGRETLLEYLAAGLPRQFSDLGGRPHKVVYSRRYQARNARAQHLIFWTRSRTLRNEPRRIA